MIIANTKSNCKIVSICIKLKKKMWNNLFVMLTRDNAIGEAFPNTDLYLLNSPIYYESFQNKIFLSTAPVSTVLRHINIHATIFGSFMHKK